MHTVKTMKTTAYLKTSSVSLILFLPLSFLLSAPDRDSADPLHPDSESAFKEVAFLGLVATNLSPEVSGRLGFPGNLYLNVAQVSSGGPAEKAGLKRGDVLKKLDDQILVNPEQLVALVRSKEIGDEVNLSIMREEKEKSLKVKLGSKNVTGVAGNLNRLHQFDENFNHRAFPNAQALEERLRRQIERQTRIFGQRGRNRKPVSPEIMEKFDVDGDGKLSPIERDKAIDEGAIEGKDLGFGLNLDFGPGPDFEKMIKDAQRRGGVSTWSSVTGSAKTKIVNSDADGTYEFSSEDGDKRFKVTSADGGVLFDGPVNTEDERAEMPEHLLERLETLEGSVRIRTDQRLPGLQKQNPKKKDRRAL